LKNMQWQALSSTAALWPVVRDLSRVERAAFAVDGGRESGNPRSHRTGWRRW